MKDRYGKLKAHDQTKENHSRLEEIKKLLYFIVITNFLTILDFNIN